MGIDPISAIGVGTDLLGGLSSIFGKKRKSAAQLQYERSLTEDRKRKQQLWDQLNSFDSSKELQGAIDFANQDLGHQLDLSNKRLIGNYAKSGGIPGGDTAFSVNRQRAIDSVSAPTGMAIANIRANARRNDLMMKLGAMGSLSPMSTPAYSPWDMQPADTSGYEMFAQGLDGLSGLLKPRKKKTQ